MVDYSKWDKLEVSSDEEDDRNRKPRITHFETPQSVTFGGGAEEAATTTTTTLAHRGIGTCLGTSIGTEAESSECRKMAAMDCRATSDHVSADATGTTRQELKPSTSNRSTQESSVRESDSPAFAGETSQGILSKPNSNTLDYNVITRNGAASGCYCWAQTRDTVTVHLIVNLDVKGKDVSLSFPPSPASTIFNDPQGSAIGTGETAVGSTIGTEESYWPKPLEGEVGQQLKLVIQQRHEGDFILNEILSYPVKTDDENISWELKTFSGILHAPSDCPPFQPTCPKSDPTCPTSEFPVPISPCPSSTSPIRCLVLSLAKFSPLAGTSVWWNRLFKSESPVDVNSFPDRPHPNQAFKDAWDEAHRMFIEKKQAHRNEDTRIVV